MGRVKLEDKCVLGFVAEEEILRQEEAVLLAHKRLHARGEEGLGWVELPLRRDRQQLDEVIRAAEQIRSHSQAFIIIGIGGSYLGARAGIQMLSHSFREVRPSGPAVYFAGHNASSTYMADLLDLLDDREISINVISKSGTTTEPAIAFRILRDYMERRYGKKKAKERIFVTTDGEKGALKKLADEEGYASFVIPDDVGGRYSVLTPVGLLPMAVAGLDVEEIIKGAADAHSRLGSPDLARNDSYRYAVLRYLLYQKGKMVELLVSYEPSLQYFAEWWKQLFGESEGKEGKGIFPASCLYTTDLHSLGQYVQEGRRILFETVIDIEQPRRKMQIPEDNSDRDGLGYLAGKTMDYVNRQALLGTLLAHTDGGVPNLVLKVPQLSPYHCGELFYFFQKACGLSGYLLGVNPFDQPGVEAYKKNMFALLGKPELAPQRRELQARLEELTPQ
ncbi:MAG: glucose-6-phosphate isomerase [Firmicutes bacterium]|jgi:glucose-6-phosphate isomerase|nr:glucose-6-phosphate isomerase [Bacillota bacterium]